MCSRRNRKKRVHVACGAHKMHKDLINLIYDHFVSLCGWERRTQKKNEKQNKK